LSLPLLSWVSACSASDASPSRASYDASRVASAHADAVASHRESGCFGQPCVANTDCCKGPKGLVCLDSICGQCRDAKDCAEVLECAGFICTCEGGQCKKRECFKPEDCMMLDRCTPGPCSCDGGQCKNVDCLSSRDCREKGVGPSRCLEHKCEKVGCLTGDDCSDLERCRGRHCRCDNDACVPADEEACRRTPVAQVFFRQDVPGRMALVRWGLFDTVSLVSSVAEKQVCLVGYASDDEDRNRRAGVASRKRVARVRSRLVRERVRRVIETVVCGADGPQRQNPESQRRVDLYAGRCEKVPEECSCWSKGRRTPLDRQATASNEAKGASEPPATRKASIRLRRTRAAAQREAGGGQGPPQTR
jgi:hypothetical protein